MENGMTQSITSEWCKYTNIRNRNIYEDNEKMTQSITLEWWMLLVTPDIYTKYQIPNIYKNAQEYIDTDIKKKEQIFSKILKRWHKVLL